MAKKKRLHVLSNTHWDREHRHGFQETRMMLVDAIDKLFSIIENDPDFKSFTFDGQTVILDDYLEIKPYMRETLKKHVLSGKILIGPWYTLPDCTPANPESLVRNLLTGHRVAKEFGPVMKAGYSIFSFGQIAQLPQLYAEFGIDKIVFYKGAPIQQLKESEFIWEAPDGTRSVCSRLGPDCRLNFFAYFTVPVILGGHMMRKSWSTSYTEGTKLCHYIDELSRGGNATELVPDIRIREKEIKPAIEAVMESVKDSVAQKTFIAFDGIDFSTPMKEIPAAIAKANEIVGDELEVIHSNIIDYFNEFVEEVDPASLRTFKGEARYGPIGAVHSETLSGTMPLKQRMFDAEQELLYYAEPFSVFSDPSLQCYRREMFDFAWKYLLKAQAHDSFHGAGVAKITPDNFFRIAQVQEIAETLTRKAFERIVADIDTSSLETHALAFTVFNPSPFTRSEIIRPTLEFPRADYVRSFSVIDPSDSTECACNVIEIYDDNHPSINAENRPKAIYSKCMLTDIFVKDVPPYGYKTFLVKRTKGNASDLPNPFGAPRYLSNPIARNSRCLDNGLIRVSINLDSTLSVYDYGTETEYTNLHSFIDSGDRGNVWIHNPPIYNKIYESVGCPHECATIENSDMGATLEIRVQMKLPQGLSSDRKSRMQASTDVVLSTRIGLKAGSRTIQFETSFDNEVRDHKISLRFQPAIQSGFTTSDSSFEFKRRPIDPLHEIKDPQAAIYRHPMQTFIDWSNGNGGLTLIAKGLHEFETGNPKTPFIDLTLLRSVSQDFPIHMEVCLKAKKEYAQCQGAQLFEYALYVHPSAFESSGAPREAERFTRPMRAMQHGKGNNGTAPLSRKGWGTVHPMTKLLCVKKAEGGNDIVIRLNNPTGIAIQEELQLAITATKAWLCNCNEEEKEELPIKGSVLPIRLEAYKIVTLKLAVP